VPAGGSSIPLNSESINDMQGPLHSSSKPTSSEDLKVEDTPISLMSKTELEPSESFIEQVTDKQTSEETLEIINDTVEIDASVEDQMPSDLALSPVHAADHEWSTSLETAESEGIDGNMLASDEYSSSVSVNLNSEDASPAFPATPLYVELTNEQKRALYKLSITRIIEDYKLIQASGCGQSRLPLLARLVAQVLRTLSGSMFGFASFYCVILSVNLHEYII